ncbi:FtsH protease activity modulator HflK [Rhodobacter sp. KR11]|jgi:membrane protease subunit HflK|uniref:FtsH protease activity modulator HflK n=1 Tax=Rhodobacter sp. KR11 TaxID=2974588 RepID=UPI00222294FC|nr:FtsH protease activity modulator HflK [Rhodobacter sp. KR11]MCW1917467.1 FtsH protease activity modulator HflK [Rhodobacter sp. KR11]
MANGNGPWGGGNGPEDDRPKGRRDDNRGPQSQIPEIDEVLRKGTEKLRVIMGGGGNGGNGGRPGQGGQGPAVTRQGLALGVLGALALWGWMSAYTVRPEEQAVELFLGEFSDIKGNGLHFAAWPLFTAEIVNTSQQRTTDVGTGAQGEADNGLMLTGDQNIVDVEFQVVWNVSNPRDFLFNLRDPEGTIRAVAESAVRDIVARSQLAPILNRDRGEVETALFTEVQATLDAYQSGISVVRINLVKSDVPEDVRDAFRAVQAAQQERDRLQKTAEAEANKVTAAARGQASQAEQDARAYAAQVVNQAQGEVSRFTAVYAEYIKAPQVTRQRMYLETMEKVLGGANKVILEGGQDALPFMPLDGLLPKAQEAK